MMSPKKRSPGDGGYYFIKSKQLWRRVWDIEPWPDGRRRTKEFTGKTKTIVNAKYDAYMEQQGKGVQSPNTTVAEWAENWLANVLRHSMTPNGLASYETTTRKWIIPVLGNKKVSALKATDVAALMKVLRDNNKSTSTMRKVYNVLSQMVDAARRNNLTDRNIVEEDVKPPKVKTKERGALSTDDAFAVLKTATEQPDGTKWWATLLAGIRQGERLAARIESLDLDNATLTVDWSLIEVTSEHGCGEPVGGRWACGKSRAGSCPQRRLKLPDGFDYVPLYGRLVMKRPKSGKPRTVPLIPPLVEALRRYLEQTAHIPNPYGLIWRHDDGTPFLPYEDQAQWRDLLHRSGVITAEQAKEPRHREPGTPDVPTTHWGRHTTATVMLELGVDVKVIGEIVGHVDAKTTRGYQHVSSALARAGMDKVGAHFAGALESPQSGGQ